MAEAEETAGAKAQRRDTRLVWSSENEKASVAGAEWAGEKVVGNEPRGMARDQAT